MTAMIRTEIAAALNNHRLASSRGWRAENGSTIYTCACGHTFETDPTSIHFLPPATLLADHQASVIEAMGYSRQADVLDEIAIEELSSLLVRRRASLAAEIDSARRCHASSEELRLHGAHSELGILFDALHKIVGIRTLGGLVELPIDDESASVA